MALTARMDAAQIADLAGRIETQRLSLETQLQSLLSSVSRADEFSGNAAAQYDAFLQRWRSAQEQMTQSMTQAGGMLKQYSAWLQEGDDRLGQGFNV